MDNWPKFILNVQDGCAFMTQKAANGVLGSKENMYRLVDEDGWFLPALKTRAITTDYLMKVVKGEVFRIQKNQLINPPSEKKVWSKIDLIAWISERCSPLPLGVTPTKLPDRRWLVSIAYGYDHNLEIFTGTQPNDVIVSLPLKFLEKMAFFDPFLKPSSKPIFQRSADVRARDDTDKIRRRVSKKQRRKNYLAQEINKLSDDIMVLEGNEEMRNNNI